MGPSYRDLQFAQLKSVQGDLWGSKGFFYGLISAPALEKRAVGAASNVFYWLDFFPLP